MSFLISLDVGTTGMPLSATMFSGSPNYATNGWVISIANCLQPGFYRTGDRSEPLFLPHHLPYILPLPPSNRHPVSATVLLPYEWCDEAHACPGSGTAPHPSAVRNRQGIFQYHYILSVPEQREHGVSFQTEDYGIPASEIRFIQECKTEKARKAVIAAMKCGGIKALGSVIHLATVIHIICRITIAEAVGDYINGKPINRIKYALN